LVVWSQFHGLVDAPGHAIGNAACVVHQIVAIPVINMKGDPVRFVLTLRVFAAPIGPVCPGEQIRSLLTSSVGHHGAVQETIRLLFRDVSVIRYKWPRSRTPRGGRALIV
jgi:hypothetical protein